VVLLDEIEKAHPEVFNILLQIMDDGWLTDGKGRRVDFRNTVIIMTGNVGADLIKRDRSLGFDVRPDDERAQKANYERMRDKVMGELKNTFRPEFLNRLDAVIVFRALTQVEIRKIVDIKLNRVRAQLTEQQMKIEVDDEAKDFLVSKGFDPNYGARPLDRAIQNFIEDPLAEGLLQGRFRPGDVVVCKMRDGEMVLEPGSASESEQSNDELVQTS
jgi:ATP-dependent Clp protease ATP-binding subunit ClpC